MIQIRKIPASSTKMIVILDLIVNDAEEHRSNDIAHGIA